MKVTIFSVAQQYATAGEQGLNFGSDETFVFAPTASDYVIDNKAVNCNRNEFFSPAT